MCSPRKYIRVHLYGDHFGVLITFDGFHGCFHEVRPDRMVQTFTFEGYPDGVSLETLILEEFLPLAREGLEKPGLDAENIDLYLGVIEERVRSRRTGAQWQLQSMAELTDQGPLAEQLSAVTASVVSAAMASA